MRIIISPAKKMRIDTDSFAPDGLPLFLDSAEILMQTLQSLSAGELQALWKCNDKIAAQNVERLRGMELRRSLTPAVLAYEGIQYRYLAPGVLETGQLEYIREHLRILSGFYGLLRPFDGVVPYRLEMQAPLSVNGGVGLYRFWGGRLAQKLAEETGCILNLASKEYSKAVEPYLPPEVRFLTCIFGERKDGKIIEKGTLCKMARGQMVRWMAERQITSPEGISGFAELGYRFSPEDSNKKQYVFLKQQEVERD